MEELDSSDSVAHAICSRLETCMTRNVGILFLFCTLCAANLDCKYSRVLFFFFVSYLVRYLFLHL